MDSPKIKLNQWTIVNVNHINMYIIGLNKQGKLYKSSYIEDYIAIDNNYITLATEDAEIELRHNENFKPTYNDKRLYRWEIVDDYGDEIKSSTFDILSKKINSFKLKDDYYVMNEYKISLEKLEDLFIKGYIEGYRDESTGKRSLFETTQITHIKLHDRYIEAFTESGSNYLLYFSNIY